MAHPHHSYDASFSYSQYHETNPQLAPPIVPSRPPFAGVPHFHSNSINNNNHNDSNNKPKKSKKHRKRHPPPGPAGVWFQSQNNGKKGQLHSSGVSPNDDEEDDAAPLVSREDDDSRSKAPTAIAVSSNPAWTAMQCDLQWMTPDAPLSAPMSTRYHCLRPHLSSDFLLLPQILNDPSMWKLQRKLVVLVHSVACHHDDIWTVELHDDTGASITAWIAPSFVQSEKRNHVEHQPLEEGEQRYIRPGYVWCIEGASLMLQDGVLPGEEEDESTAHCTKRVILVRQSHVTRVWTPTSLQQLDPRLYKQWIEERSTIHGPDATAAAISSRKPQDDDSEQGSENAGMNLRDEEEEEEDEIDRYHREQEHAFRLAMQVEETGDVGGTRITLSNQKSGNWMEEGDQVSQQRKQAPTRNLPPQVILSQCADNNFMEEEEQDTGSAMLMQTLMNFQTQSPSSNARQNVQHHTAVFDRQSTFEMPAAESRPIPQPAQRRRPIPNNHHHQVTQPSDVHGQRCRSDGNRDQRSNQSRSRRVSLSQLPDELVFQPQSSQMTPHSNMAHNGKENKRSRTKTSDQRHGSNLAHQSSAANPSPSSDLSHFGAFVQPTPKGPAQELSQFSARTEKPPIGKQETHHSLSQFSAMRGEATPPPSASSLASKDLAVKHKETSTPNTRLSQTPNGTASLPQKRQKSNSPKKTKSPKYDTPPKPSAAKLWTSAAALEDTTGLLDLSSSDEDETHETEKRRKNLQTTKHPEPAAETENSTMVQPQESMGKAEADGAAAETSLFRAVCQPGMDWIGLSDEDD